MTRGAIIPEAARARLSSDAAEKAGIVVVVADTVLRLADQEKLWWRAA